MTNYVGRRCARFNRRLSHLSRQRAILSARRNLQPSRPGNSSPSHEVAALQAKNYRRCLLCLVGFACSLLLLTCGCITRDSDGANSSSQTPPTTAANQSPIAVASPTPSAAAPTPVVNAALDGWPLPPLVGGEWVAVDKQGARTLLDQLVAHSPSNAVGTAQQITRFRTKSLSFYPGAKLCEGLVPAAGSGEASIFSFILLQDGTVTLLDGTATPIQGLDENAPVALDTPEQSESYLRFFAAAIFANGGNFRIVDGVDDPLWARDATASDKQRAATYIRPLALNRLDDGRWKANATVQYGTTLSSVVFYLDPNGEATKVEMTDDVTVASNLPLRREAFNGPLRYEIGLYK